MGVAEDTSHFSKPDYTRSVEEIYTDFARAVIDRDHSMAILCYARSGLVMPEVGVSSHPRYDLLPSWVPHWTWGRKTLRIASVLYNNASSPTPAYAFRSPTELCVQGFVFDRITRVEGPPFLSPQKYRWVDAALEGSVETDYPTGIPRLQAFFRTLLIDRLEVEGTRLDASPDVFFNLAAAFLFALPVYVSRTHPVPEEMVDPANEPDYIIGLLRFLRQTRGNRSNREILGTYFGTNLTAPEEETALGRGTLNLKTYSIAEARTTRHRSFFTTEKGYMGLSPSRVSPGDCVCIIPGCPLPMTLRKDCSAYTLVGECFVLGLMDEETFDAAMQGGAVIQEFCLH